MFYFSWSKEITFPIFDQKVNIYFFTCNESSWVTFRVFSCKKRNRKNEWTWLTVSRKPHICHFEKKDSINHICQVFQINYIFSGKALLFSRLRDRFLHILITFIRIAHSSFRFPTVKTGRKRKWTATWQDTGKIKCLGLRPIHTTVKYLPVEEHEPCYFVRTNCSYHVFWDRYGLMILGDWDHKRLLPHRRKRLEYHFLNCYISLSNNVVDRMHSTIDQLRIGPVAKMLIVNPTFQTWSLAHFLSDPW